MNFLPMSNKLNETLTKLRNDEAALKERLKVVSVQIEALIMAGATEDSPMAGDGLKLAGTARKAPAKAKGDNRAPHGAIKDAIRKALAAGSLNNQALRQRIKADGYKWSVQREYVSKLLQRMVKAGELGTEGPENNRLYTLPSSLQKAS